MSHSDHNGTVNVKPEQDPEYLKVRTLVTAFADVCKSSGLTMVFTVIRTEQGLHAGMSENMLSSTAAGCEEAAPATSNSICTRCGFPRFDHAIEQPYECAQTECEGFSYLPRSGGPGAPSEAGSKELSEPRKTDDAGFEVGHWPDNPHSERKYTEADLRRAREEGSKRMKCGHLEADMVWHQGTYSLAESGPNIGMWVCSCGTVLGDQPIDEIDSFFNAHAATSAYCRICAEQQKVREEATVAAAHAQRLLVEALEACHHFLSHTGNHRALVGDNFSKPSMRYNELKRVTTLAANAIRNAPLVTSDEGAEWLRKHDAAMLLGLMGKENILAKGHWDDEGDFVAVVVADRTSLEQLADAQSTGTPAGTP